MPDFVYKKYDEVFEPLQKAGEELDMLFEMANLRQNETGLPMIIWCDVDRKGSHNQPRIKVSTSYAIHAGDGEQVSVSIEDNPRILQKDKQNSLSAADLQAVTEYIHLNKAALLGYWNGEIGTLELHHHLKKIG